MALWNLSPRRRSETRPESRMDVAQRLWMRLYQGNPPWQEPGTPSLSLAAQIAGELARLSTVEMRAALHPAAEGDAGRAAYLDAQLQRVMARIRPLVELAAATGSLLLKPTVEGGRILVDAARPGMFSVTQTDPDGAITGCDFLDRVTLDERPYLRVESHLLMPAGYRIENHAYRQDAGGPTHGHGREVPLDTVPAWAGLSPQVLFAGIERPLFAHLRMPQANPIDPDSPLGASVYARSIDLLREADLQFQRLLWEMESGERALYVDLRAFEADGADPGRLPKKRLYRTMDVDPQADTLFAEWSPPLREESHLRALDAILERIEDSVGLSRGTLSRGQGEGRGAYTATQLKMLRQRTFSTVRDLQRAIESALTELLHAMDAWATLYGLAPEGAYAAAFEFDDSVVTDRSEEFTERLKLAELGALAPWELRAWYLGEPAAIAAVKNPEGFSPKERG